MRKKVAFITGGGGFIGSELSFRMAEEGISVAVADINAELVEKTVEKIRANGGVAKGYTMDVTDSAQVNAAMGGACDELGGLDIVIHSAGGAAREKIGHILAEQTDEVLLRVLRNNLLGGLWVSRAAGQLMIRQGTGGNIVLISSLIGLMGGCTGTDYAAAKSGLISMTPCLAKEFAPYKIRVNCVVPGVVIRPWEANQHHRAYETNLLGEKCEAADVFYLIDYLVSDEARFLTGQSYVLDGGRSLSLKGSD